MPRPCPPEFREGAIELVREGRQVMQTTADLGIHEVTLYSWLRQDDIDTGRTPVDRPAKTQSSEQHEPELDSSNQELEIVKRASYWLSEPERVDLKGPTR